MVRAGDNIQLYLEHVPCHKAFWGVDINLCPVRKFDDEAVATSMALWYCDVYRLWLWFWLWFWLWLWLWLWLWTWWCSSNWMLILNRLGQQAILSRSHQQGWRLRSRHRAWRLRLYCEFNQLCLDRSWH